MPKDFDTLEDSNPSSNPSIHDISPPSRRIFLQGGLAAAAATLFAPLRAGAENAATSPLLGFRAVATSTADNVTVPDGYTTQVIAAWGDPVGVRGRMPAFRFDASNTAADQAAQYGMHHDGMHFFPLDNGSHGLLAINHEYADDGLLHTDGMRTWNADKARKSQASHGVSVSEVRRRGDKWDVVRPSKYASRITAFTPMRIAGPAAGHALMRTADDPAGVRVLGTLNNCGSGRTPWGTYLTCEENFSGYFRGPKDPDALQRRYDIGPRTYGYRWEEFEERWDATKHPNEPNRFGWIVEIDPFDPAAMPVKRTALGRGTHESAAIALSADKRAVVYSGEDASFEYIYKFVSRDKMKPGGARANATLLDHGTLYVARFDADGTGRWLPLVQGTGPLTPVYGFADAGDVAIKTRMACDLVGGTKMDRPEWTIVDGEGWVYCSLTSNSARGTKDRPAADAANPRARNTMGHVIRWKEDGDHAAETFRWNHFVLAGDARNERAEARGNIDGDAFANPDGLSVDGRGVLWIHTDMSSTAQARDEWSKLGNNALLAADARTGEVRRFLTGPVGCEIVGASFTPDMRTMFVNMQHPGEGPGARTNPDEPRKRSNWPDFRPDGRPRSATVVVRKVDGGVIGT